MSGARPQLSEDRANEITTFVVDTVAAFCNRLPSDEHPAPVPMDDAEWWGATCAAAEIIRLIVGRELPEFVMGLTITRPDDGTIHSAASRLAGQIICTYCNGDTAMARDLWTAAPGPVGGAAIAHVFAVAGAVLRATTTEIDRDHEDPS